MLSLAEKYLESYAKGVESQEPTDGDRDNQLNMKAECRRTFIQKEKKVKKMRIKVSRAMIGGSQILIRAGKEYCSVRYAIKNRIKPSSIIIDISKTRIELERS